MSIHVLMGGPEEPVEAGTGRARVDADEFFAKNAFRMVYQTNNFFLPQIRDLIDRGEVLNLRPEYQRRSRWSTQQKSRLIESLLLNIPVPPVFFYESTAARYEVMDGQQRLNAVREFIAGDFALSGLPVLKPLNGLRYSRCPPRIKRALERANIAAIVLLLESESAEATSGRLTLTDIRRFIFDRLNTGGTKLNSQEIRNALNPGVFNRVLIDITRLAIFTTVFDIPPYVEADPNDYYENSDRQKNRLYGSMRDCQLALRYFALKDKQNIRGSMKSMLDRAMAVDIAEEVGVHWKNDFEERFRFLYELFDSRPFRLPPDETGRDRLSAAIYDSAMVAIDACWRQRSEIEKDRKRVQGRMEAATTDPDNFNVLTGQQNTAKGIRERIRLMKHILLPR